MVNCMTYEIWRNNSVKKEFNEELNKQLHVEDAETIVDQPWDYQFEEDQEPATRSAKLHPVAANSLYTKLIFGVVALLILVIVGYFLASAAGLLKGGSAATTVSQTPKLTLQSQSTATTKKAEGNEATTAAGDNKSSETTQASQSKSSEAAQTTAAMTSQTETQAATQEQTVQPANAAGGSTHTIQPGDSLWAVAQRYGVTVDALRAANGATAASMVVGQTLVIPGASGAVATPAQTAPVAGNGAYHTIRYGDTLSAIARTYGLSLTQLKQMNGLVSDNVPVGTQLRVGQ